MNKVEAMHSPMDAIKKRGIDRIGLDIFKCKRRSVRRRVWCMYRTGL